MQESATLQQLSTPQGASELAKRLGSVESFFNEGPEAAQDVVRLVKEQLSKFPELGDVKLRIKPGVHGGYFPGADMLTLGVVNPAVTAHELGHVKNIRNSRIYGKILQAANNLARINNVAALPAMLGLRAFVGDENLRNEIFNVLSGMSAAVAAPGLIEEISASIDAVKNSPNKLQAMKALIPAFLHHALYASVPVGVYQLGRHL